MGKLPFKENVSFARIMNYTVVAGITFHKSLLAKVELNWMGKKKTVQSVYLKREREKGKEILTNIKDFLLC